MCNSTESLEELLEPAGLDGRPFDSAPLVELEARRVLEASRLLCLIEKPDAALLSSIYADGLTGTKRRGDFISVPALSECAAVGRYVGWRLMRSSWQTRREAQRPVGRSGGTAAIGAGRPR